MNFVKQGRKSAKKTLEKCIAVAQQWASAPENAEHLHGLRVSLRRLRSHAIFLESILPDQKNHETSVKMKQLIHLLGPLRDQYVEKEWIAQWLHKHRNEPVHAKNFALLRPMESAPAPKISVDIVRALQSSNIDHFLEERWTTLEKTSPVQYELLLSAQYNRGLLKIQNRILKLNETDKKTLHSVRVSCKQLRYFCEEMKFPKKKSERQRTLDALIKIQTRFGKVQDLVLLKSALQPNFETRPDAEQLTKQEKKKANKQENNKISNNIRQDLDLDLEQQTKKALALVGQKTPLRKHSLHRIRVA